MKHFPRSRVCPWPGAVLAPTTRVLVVLAHPDDEIACGGLAQRLPPTARFLWVTDGDALAEGAGLRRPEYAAARHLESEAAMGAIGVSVDRLRFLGNSEVGIFEALARCAAKPNARHDVFEHARSLARQITAEVLAFRPEVVFTVAWQGAHPVHDLVHLLVRHALRPPEHGGCGEGLRMQSLAAAGVASGRSNIRLPDTLLFEMPLFDPWGVLPLRFPPWHQGPVHEVRLTSDEAAAKRRMTRCWPSQDVVLKPLEAIVTVAGGIAALAGHPFDLDSLLAVERFAPVPRDRDYVKSPHGFEFLDHPLERWQGARISHSASIAPIAQALMA